MGLKTHDSSFDHTSVQKQRLTDDLRKKMMLASALAAKGSNCGPLEVKSKWLANYGLALAARNATSKGDSATIQFDFSECEGLDIHGTHATQIENTLPKGGDWQLIAEMVPSTADLRDRNFRYRISGRW